MRIRFITAIGLVALLLAPSVLLAQSKPATAKPPAISVTLVYHEDNSGIFDIKDEKKASVADVQDGDELKPGWTVVTGKGDLAELKINHTSTIIKVSGNTNFTLDKLRTAAGGQDAFTLTIGKVRTVAGKASTKDMYQIKTQSAVCGVRGSDVVIETSDGTATKLSTLEGTGWMKAATATGQAPEDKLYRLASFSDEDGVDVPAQFELDSGAPAPVKIPADIFKSLQEEMKFFKLDVNETLSVNKAYQASLQQGGGTSTPSETPTTPPAPQTNSTMDNILTMLRDILGFEIGSINVSDANGNTVTYAKAVFQPTFTIGKLKMALYLPVIYQGDMFNTSDWYRPNGNDEWSFGSDQHGLTNAAADITRDLLLKIKYIEYGRQRDPFFLKVGNLNDITIGHGLIMRNYANDADFPAVRHVGVNVGVDGDGGGFEAMVSDIAPDIIGGTLSPPDIMGARFYIRPVPGFRMALGVSTIIDLNPARDFVDAFTGPIPDPDAAGNPIFINPGVDLDLPVVETDPFSLVFFTDAALMMPYFRDVPTDPAFSTIKQGLATKAFLDTSAKMPFKNWGAASGIFGNLVFPGFTYRLQYQIYTGQFRPEFYDSGYERNRGGLVRDTLNYLVSGAATSEAYNMGVYGEGGFKLEKKFGLTFGYFWPWEYDPSQGGLGAGDPHTDHFIARFSIEPGVIPVINIWGSVSYERTGLAAAGFTNALFDANTVVSAQVNYPVSPIMDVSLIYTTTAARDGNGNLIYEGSSILPKMTTSLSIQTMVHL